MNKFDAGPEPELPQPKKPTPLQIVVSWFWALVLIAIIALLFVSCVMAFNA